MTTTTDPVLGQEVEIEGIVAVDRDFGAGYGYAVIVEDAQVTGEPGGGDDG